MMMVDMKNVTAARLSYTAAIGSVVSQRHILKTGL